MSNKCCSFNYLAGIRISDSEKTSKSVKPKDHTVCVIDDDKDIIDLLKKSLAGLACSVYGATNIIDGIALITRTLPQLIILDVHLEAGRSSISHLPILKKQFPQATLFMMSASSDPKTIISAMQGGASDYLLKPIDLKILKQKVGEHLVLATRKRSLQQLSNTDSAIIGHHPLTQKLRQEVIFYANYDSNVLIQGESGTGKTLVAKCIHEQSKRCSGQFIAINCASIPENLLESELFGHEKGAFTGADRTQIGKFEAANGGTLLLDEITELSLSMQAKLLRAVQGKEFERVGSVKTIHSDVRLIAATNHNIENEVRAKNFREDLYFRLNILPLFIPPLRERRIDIPILAEHFLTVISQRLKKYFDGLDETAIATLSQQPWPGNVRQLEHVMERAIVIGQPPLLSHEDLQLTPVITSSSAPSNHHSLSRTLSSLGEIEYRHLMETLNQNGGNIAKTARDLGISRRTIYNRLKKFNISLDRKHR